MILEQLIGQVLDEKYRIDKKLGQGGMGAVYLAAHIGTKRLVAVKVIAPQFMENANFVERFKREAEAAGRLRHPNVVNVTDFGFATVGEDKVAYLVMEYLDGNTLGALLETEKTLPLQFVVDIVEQVCLAIDRAHSQGIIHRDLKPDNIWLEPNGRGGYNVKVLDFGLAKLRTAVSVSAAERQAKAAASKASFRSSETAADENDPEIEIATVLKTVPIDAKTNAHEADTMLIENRATTGSKDIDTSPAEGLTQAGDVLGTPLYMSPEQCGGAPLDGRSDVYSLGVIIYQMLSGETPFKGTLGTLISSHIQKPPTPLKEKIASIPDPVADLVMSALAKKPEDRPPNAAAFGTALRANASGESAILRQAIALYGEHFADFIRISLIGYSPMIGGIILFFIGLLVPALHTPAVISFIILFFFLVQVLNNAVTGGVIVPMVAHFTRSPLEPFQIGPVLAVFRSRFKAYMITSLVAHKNFMLYVALPIIASTALPLNADSWAYWIVLLALLAVTGLLLRSDFLSGKWLYTPVTVWENMQGNASLERSGALIARLEGTLGKIFPLFVFVIINVSILAIMVSWSLMKNIRQGAGPADSAVEITAAGLGVTLSIVLCTLLCPLIGIGYALFYLKARQAGGETFKEI